MKYDEVDERNSNLVELGRDPFTLIRYKFRNHRRKSMPRAWNVLFINSRLSRPSRNIEYEIGTRVELEVERQESHFSQI